ncbi:MAG: sigma-70 family RNA polymerase sigma factor [Bacteroidales bacterium]|nr:sigma-70 family RNA polymerase sigma factor [Bacteroidales bacterium]
MRAFYERYVGYLTAVCSRYVPDRAAVKDILQEVFVKVFGKIGNFEFRGEGSLKAWLHRIVVNDSLKFLRVNGRMKYVDDLPDVEDETMDNLPDVPVAVVAEMIKALPDGYRTVFNLFVFEKKSHREIAELLGIKEDSSASQFFRARAMLARKIKDYLKANG